MGLEKYRQEINELDRQIVTLLNQRAELAKKIGALKKVGEQQVYDPEREQQVLANVTEVNSGPLSDEAIRAIYTEVLSACRSLERPLRVAYLGPEATFTHEAAKKHFGSSAMLVPTKSIEQVFVKTEKGEVDYGVVPVENSLEGAVSHTLDMFLDSDLKICAEVTLEISQHLLSNNPLGGIHRIYSHPQAIAQCRNWLAERMPQAEIVEVASTARGAELAAQESGSAAIATELAADIYGLKVVERDIQDHLNNVTRFLVIGQQMGRRTGKNRTGLMFAIRDRVGALHDTLAMFRANNINLSMIQSRPSKRKAWDYYFFADLEGHPEDPNVAVALEELHRECLEVKVLGAWQRE